MAFHISSIPFVTKVSLVIYYVVTPVEFLKSSVIASLINVHERYIIWRLRCTFGVLSQQPLAVLVFFCAYQQR
jgi:hypothetical protein